MTLFDRWRWVGLLGFVGCGQGVVPSEDTSLAKEVEQVSDSNPVRPVIFIPGVMATHLYSVQQSHLAKNDFVEEVWLNQNAPNPIAPMLNADSHRKLTLFRRADIPTIDDLRVGEPFMVIAGSIQIYSGLVSHLTSLGYQASRLAPGDLPKLDASNPCVAPDNKNQSYSMFLFGTDWRQNVMDTAELLPEYVACALRNFNQNRETPATDVDIIAHSQGGLIASIFLKQNASRVHRLITVATPWLGTPAALYAMATGEGTLPRTSVSAEVIQEVAQSLPGTHQLLPSRHYAALTAPDPFWVADGIPKWSQGMQAITSYTDTNFDAFVGMLNDEMGWPRVDDTNGDQIQGQMPGDNAELLHSEVSDMSKWTPVEGADKLYQIVGLEVDDEGAPLATTVGEVTTTEGGWDLGGRAALFGKHNGTSYNWTPSKRVYGDGLVPLASACRNNIMPQCRQTETAEQALRRSQVFLTDLNPPGAIAEDRFAVIPISRSDFPLEVKAMGAILPISAQQNTNADFQPHCYMMGDPAVLAQIQTFLTAQ